MKYLCEKRRPLTLCMSILVMLRQENDVTVLTAGTFTFMCQIHPAMVTAITSLRSVEEETYLRLGVVEAGTMAYPIR